jgi:hypothetical protein
MKEFPMSVLLFRVSDGELEEVYRSTQDHADFVRNDIFLYFMD